MSKILYSLLLVTSIACGQGIKISQYPNTTMMSDNDLLLIAQGGITNKNITYQQFLHQIGTNITSRVAAGSNATVVVSQSGNTITYTVSSTATGTGGGGIGQVNTNQFNTNNGVASIVTGATLTNTQTTATSGNASRVSYANNVMAIGVTGDGTIISQDSFGTVILSYTNGMSQAFIGRDLTVNGGISGNGTGNWTNTSVAGAPGIMTNSASGEQGSSQSIPAAWIIGLVQVNALTNNDTRTITFYGPMTLLSTTSFGTNANKSSFGANGALTVSVPGPEDLVFRKYGDPTNGNPILMQASGTDDVVTVSAVLAMNTNYYATNWVPIPGKTKFCPSNNAIYSVSTTKTNLIVTP